MKDELNLATQILRSLPVLKRVPKTKLQIFALDIYLVARGVRTGYLFDAFSVSGRSTDPTSVLSQILSSLREKIAIFERVVVFKIASSDDHFFVNAPLFLERFSIGDPDGQCADLSWVTFVSLSGAHPAVLPAVPVGVQGVLETICTQLLEHSHTTYPPTIIIDDSDCEVPAWDIVPLAGLILEYAVAYVPNEQSFAESKFLGGVDLEIYTCVLSWQGTEGHLGGASEHTLLQFSCPSSIAQQTDSITRRIHERFTTRLAFASLDCKLHVSSRTTIPDRVAL
ncbi:hypothetical protein BDW22DRAFT_940954 [Trametopsis cervina]|nr:hypothetical protein BDW22DRAFT_940954 [Trametopsis cervina]